MHESVTFAALIIAGLAYGATPAPETRNVGKGDIDVLELAFTPKPNPLVGAKEIIEVKPGNNPRQLFVVGLKQGTSSLHVMKENGELGRNLLYTVSAGNVQATLLKVKKLLESVEGIDIEARDGMVVIDGELLTAADRIRVKKVVAAHPDEVLDLTRMSKLVR